MTHSIKYIMDNQEINEINPKIKFSSWVKYLIGVNIFLGLPLGIIYILYIFIFKSFSKL